MSDLFPRYAVKSTAPTPQSDPRLWAAKTFAEEVDEEMERLKVKRETRQAVRALYRGLAEARAFRRK